MHNKTRKRQKFTGGNILPPEIYEILKSSGIHSNQMNITPEKAKEIIEKMRKYSDLLPFIENNPALKELLKTSGGTRYKKTRKQKGGLSLPLFLAALTYPFLGATHSPGNTPQHKAMRALTAAARAEAAGQKALHNAEKKGEQMQFNITNPPINPYLNVSKDPPPFKINNIKYINFYKPSNTN